MNCNRIQFNCAAQCELRLHGDPRQLHCLLGVYVSALHQQNGYSCIAIQCMQCNPTQLELHRSTIRNAMELQPIAIASQCICIAPIECNCHATRVHLHSLRPGCDCISSRMQLHCDAKALGPGVIGLQTNATALQCNAIALQPTANKF